jgi:hypothetical protein
VQVGVDRVGRLAVKSVWCVACVYSCCHTCTLLYHLIVVVIRQRTDSKVILSTPTILLVLAHEILCNLLFIFCVTPPHAGYIICILFDVRTYIVYTNNSAHQYNETIIMINNYHNECHNECRIINSQDKLAACPGFKARNKQRYHIRVDGNTENASGAGTLLRDSLPTISALSLASFQRHLHALIQHRCSWLWYSPFTVVFSEVGEGRLCFLVVNVFMPGP